MSPVQIPAVTASSWRDSGASNGSCCRKERSAMASRRSSYGRVFQRKGRPGFYVRVRRDGREIECWAGPDRKTATEFLNEMVRTMAREKLLGEKAVPAVTFAEFERQLVEHLRARHADTTLEVEQRRLRDICVWFGTKALRDIGQGDVQ